MKRTTLYLALAALAASPAISGKTEYDTRSFSDDLSSTAPLNVSKTTSASEPLTIRKPLPHSTIIPVEQVPPTKHVVEQPAPLFPEIHRDVLMRFFSAIQETYRNLTNKRANPTEPLKAFYKTYKTDFQKTMTLREPRSHALIEASCAGLLETTDRTVRRQLQTFSTTEKDVINAVTKLIKGDLSGAQEICKKIAERGRTASYHDHHASSELPIPLSRAMSCAICEPTFAGKNPSQHEHPYAWKAACPAMYGL